MKENEINDLVVLLRPIQTETQKQEIHLQELKNFQTKNNRLNDNPDLLALISAQKLIVDGLKARDRAMEEYVLPESLVIRTFMSVEANKLLTHRVSMETLFVEIDDVVFEINKVAERKSEYPGIKDGEYFFADNAVHTQTGWQNYYHYGSNGAGFQDSSVFKVIATSNEEKYPKVPVLTVKDLARPRITIAKFEK
ncbi:MAG: hypothetical protein NTY80_03985 [candidate division SR1 bacterium]|nr:hypothetical protein [candidate division SR1 bacterium]